ncbi:uncharacterized protein B0T15DRAFT_313054 [Chaetomium strumarium]|uniref:Uncharacterized protein n=1 Tax=Chaetomium strumarium TaxID=1170767 RepID=A0AAJ0GMK2_9PEZI|nr:hypothetical protein B0T15DRAFT_313054 [Chaetomium strumarium]
MNFLRKLVGRPEDANKPPTDANDQPQSTFITPDPFASPAQFQAVKEHIQALARRDPARFAALRRMAAFQGSLAWLEANFPDESKHEIIVPGPFPDAFPGPLNGPGLEHIQPGDTRIFFMRRKDVSGPAGIVLMQLTVFPGTEVTGEDGESVMWLGTPAMETAVAAFLGLLRRMVDSGNLEKCTAIIAMGVDMTIYHFTPERGFFDPPEGFGFRQEKLDWDQEGILPKV